MKIMIVCVALCLTAVVACVQDAAENTRQRPLIIAHRGAPETAPENTLAALRAAMDMQSDVLEIDVRQTRDGYFVVMHDGSVDRTTDGSGTVERTTLAELQRLDAGSWFDPAFAGERIPTLNDVLAILDSTTILIVEFKGRSEDGSAERKLVQTITGSGKQRQVILKSFEPAVIASFKQLAPDIPRLFVYVFHVPWLNLIVGTGVSKGSVFEIDAHYLQPHIVLLTPSFVREAHEQGFRVVAWGVHDEKTMQKAVALGVDGIETNRPDVLRRLLSSDLSPD